MTSRIIIEKGDHGFFGRIENNAYQPVTYGTNTSEVLTNLHELILDYIKHEKNLDKFWSRINPKELSFELSYQE